MESAEKIVEEYVLYIKRWTTLQDSECSRYPQITFIAADHKHRRQYIAQSRRRPECVAVMHEQ